MADEFSGSLREQVVIERTVMVPDEYGGAAPIWTRLADAWAALIPGDRNAPIIGETRVSRAQYNVVMRRVDGVTMADRLQWRGRYYRLLRVGQDPRRPAQMELLIEEMP